MAQTRLEKIGTIYSRMLGLYQSGASKYENRPIWFDVYEAFPPKYEPRWDRHQLPYGNGGNVNKLGPPRKIMYKEDIVRAQFFKVFGGDDQDVLPNESIEEGRKLKHTYNLFDNYSENIAQKFVNKYLELEQTTPVGSSASGGERNVFRETIDAMELEGINLLNFDQPEKIEEEEKVIESDTDIESSRKQEEVPKFKRPSLREIFQKESERNNEDDK